MNFRLFTPHNAIKAPQRYAVQVSDTTMFNEAASSPGQQILRK